MRISNELQRPRFVHICLGTRKPFGDYKDTKEISFNQEEQLNPAH
jgi:hypothetical protein